METYIDWHIESKPHKQEVLRFALDQLIEQEYDLQTIQTLKGAENRAFWQELNIPPGIGIQLARDVSKFGREMTSRRRMPPPPISSFQRALPLDHDLPANERLPARISTQEMLSTQITQATQATQASIPFSQRSTQDEDDDETRRR